MRINPSAKKHCHIYDMDGVLVNSEHRYRVLDTGKIDLIHWRENEPLAYKDTLLPLATQYKADLENPLCTVIICTARVLHNPDDEFIRDVLGCPNVVISRKIDDTRSSTITKVNGLRKVFNLKGFQEFNAVRVWEDNHTYLKAICDAFNIMGVYVPSKQGH